MIGCVLSQLKPSELYILSFEKGLGLRPLAFFKNKNVELLGLYPIHNKSFLVTLTPLCTTTVVFNLFLFVDQITNIGNEMSV